MAKGSNAEQAVKQAAGVMKQLQGKGKHVASRGTVRSYEQCLRNIARHFGERGTKLRAVTPQQATQYLVDRSVEIGQKTLDQERQALQMMLQNATRELDPTEKLAVIKSEHEQILESRAYTPEQVQLVADHQSERNALATAIAVEAGLRAHELITIVPMEERAPDVREEHQHVEHTWEGREGVHYTVEGKGGLVREVILSPENAERLEQCRLDEPVTYIDRGVSYESHYDIGKGQAWSQSFSSAANRVLGWSEGAHGLRHTYAQDRVEELQQRGYTYGEALAAVSHEMGHLRAEITEVYLR